MADATPSPIKATFGMLAARLSPAFLHMHSPRRPTDQPLTLLEVSRWTLEPSRALDDLLSLGRLDIEGMRALATLANVLDELTGFHPGMTPDTSPAHKLISELESGKTVEADTIEHAQRWLEEAATAMRCIKRADLQHALNLLINRVEEQKVLDKLLEPPLCNKSEG